MKENVPKMNCMIVIGTSITISFDSSREKMTLNFYCKRVLIEKANNEI